MFNTVENIPREKAMRPDGIPNEFYKTFAKLVTPKLASVYNEAHENVMLSKAIKKGTIALLCKKAERTSEITGQLHY